MMCLRRLLRDYHDAGAVNGLLAPWAFVDDETFLTKAGHLGVVYAIRGVDGEALPHAQRRALTHRFEAALRLLDEHVLVYQYLIKQTPPPFESAVCPKPVAHDAIQRRVGYLNDRRHTLSTIDAFLVLLYEPPSPVRRSTTLHGLRENVREGLRGWLSGSHATRVMATELDRAIVTLHHKAQAFEVQLADFGVRRLPKAEAFKFMRRLVNYEPAVVDAARLSHDVHLDYFIADSPVECHRDHLTVGRRHVRLLTMKEPPNQTFAHILGNLLGVPGEFVACLEWQRTASDRMRRDIQTRRRHFFNRRVSMINYLTPDTQADEMLVDDSAGAMVRQLGDALTELEVNGHFFGRCSLTLALHGTDDRALDQQAAEAMKVLAVHDGSLFEESYNALNAWLAMVPGNGALNVRRMALLETNLADLSTLFLPDAGEPVSMHLGQEALAVFETPSSTTYAYVPHVQDVAHTLVLGATGSGKSFLLNFLVTHAQKYDPVTVVLDLGHSYRKLATLLEGQYLEVGLRQEGVTINPFALDPSPENLHFLHAFVRVLLEGQDSYRLSDAEDREVYEAIENLYVLERAQRRLFTLANLLPRALADRLHKWVEGGRYASLFDNIDDTLTVSRLQVFDFEAMRAYPALLEPLLFYVLHRVTARVLEPSETATLKLCVMDEAWRFIQHPTLRAYVQEGLKTWRKRNAMMVLATQAIDDFASADLLRTVVESCPTKLLLPNPSLDTRQYVDLFHLNPMEVELLTGLVPHQQFLLKRPTLAKVLSLTVDPKSYWIYTNTPTDNERVATVFRDIGFEAGLARLAESA